MSNNDDMQYIKHFADQPKNYLRFRPTYPDQLFNYLSSLIKVHDRAWDAGTGNGQVASNLANYFHEVIATDISQEQLDIAIKKPNIHYICCSSEDTNLSDHSIDLITVSQALHWFELDKFYREVKRVGKSDGIISAWCYTLGSINVTIDPIIQKLYRDILGDKYWPKERLYIEEEYKTIPFPFKQINSPQFQVQKKFNFEEFISYLNTWSAVKEYSKRNQNNPIDLIFSDLKTAWGNPQHENIMYWPLHLLVGYIT